MEFSDEAKREIERNLGEIVRNVNVDGKECDEIVKELRSTYYEAAEDEARERGADTVSAKDARKARACISAPMETAESFMKSYAGMRKRAGFWSRLVAFIIDNIIIFALALIVMAPAFGIVYLMGMPLEDKAASAVWFDTLSLSGMIVFGVVSLAAAVSVMAIVFGYYIVLEGHFGYTIGKHLLGLRVLRTDGTKIGYKEALLRNLSKYINNLIVIDTLIMLIFFNREKQRGFDRIANTMVVHVRNG